MLSSYLAGALICGALLTGLTIWDHLAVRTFRGLFGRVWAISAGLATIGSAGCLLLVGGHCLSVTSPVEAILESSAATRAGIMVGDTVKGGDWEAADTALHHGVRQLHLTLSRKDGTEASVVLQTDGDASSLFDAGVVLPLGNLKILARDIPYVLAEIQLLSFQYFTAQLPPMYQVEPVVLPLQGDRRVGDAFVVGSAIWFAASTYLFALVELAYLLLGTIRVRQPSLDPLPSQVQG